MTATAPMLTLAMNAVAFSPANFDPTLGMGGYAFPYADPTSFSCLNGSVFCAGGTVGAASAYGAGVGVNLNQTTGSTAASTYTPTGKSGITYTLTNLPPKTVMIIDNNGVAYQATLAAASGMVPWAMFTVQTPDAGAPTLSGPPLATHINFQVGTSTLATTFNFCVTALDFY